jgi:peptidoglycan/LPS O-acetylase OafA/YrhL
VRPLDGLRGLGILAIMIHHSFPLDTYSFVGVVDIFFVMSGFLITTLLLQEHRGRGQMDLARFYARRALRLLPLLYVVLLSTAIVGVAIKQAGLLAGTPYTLSELAKETVAGGLLVHNLVFPTLGGAWHAHLWALSVEEQFYLIVGIVLFVAFKKGGMRVVTWLLIALVAAIQISRLFFITGPFKELALSIWLQRPDSLMVGVLCAIANAKLADPLSARAQKWIKIGGYLGIVGVIGGIFASTSFARHQLGISIQFWPADPNFTTVPGQVIDRLVAQPGWRLRIDRFYWLQFGFTLVSWSCFLLMLSASRAREWKPNRAASWRPLVMIGALLSYGLYLWHYPVQQVIRIVMGTTHDSCDGKVDLTDCRFGDHYRIAGVSPLLQITLDFGLPFVLAVSTYLLIEKRALAVKNRFRVDPRESLPASTDSDVGS